jgi:hypothetical protein
VQSVVPFTLFSSSTKESVSLSSTHSRISATIYSSSSNKFLVDVAGNCKAIRTDFDHKIISGAVRKYLRDKEIAVTAAPPRQQHKNGLVERKYQTN